MPRGRPTGKRHKVHQVVPEILFLAQDFADDLFIWRASRDYRREEIATMIGMSEAAITLAEGEWHVPSLNTYVRLCALMRVPLSKYMKGWVEPDDGTDQSGGRTSAPEAPGGEPSDAGDQGG